MPSLIQVEHLRSPLGISGRSDAKAIIPLALDLLKNFENWQPAAYDDPVGYCTIGYGHLIALSRCEMLQLGRFAVPLTEPQGAALLGDDSHYASSAVQNLVTVPLTDEQFSALSSFVFNVGARNFEHSTLRLVLNQGDYNTAASEFGRWIRSRGRTLDGLKSRRACESLLFQGRLHYDANGRFNRAACVALGIAETSGPPIDIEIGEQ